MKKKIQLSLFSFFLSFCSSFCQDLHVHYDAQTKAVRYLSEGKELTKPKVKKGNNIFFHVDNYNNYLYKVEIKANERTYQIGDNSANLLNALQPGGLSMTSFFGDLNSGIDDGYGNLEDTEFGGGGFTASSAEFAKLNQLKLQFDDLAGEMIQTESQLRAIQKSVQDYKTAQEIKYLAYEEVQKIKYNPSFSPAQIKKLATEYLEKGLEVQSIDELNVEELLKRNNSTKTLTDRLARLKDAHQRYIQQSETLSNIGSLLNQYTLSDEEFLQFKYTVDEIQNKAQIVEQKVTQQEIELENLVNQPTQNDMNVLTSMHYEYEGIANNNFSHTYRTEADGDWQELELTFLTKDSAGRGVSEETIQVAPIKVPVYGGIKISTSIGISFGQYFDRPQNYFIRDGAIFAEDEDSFYPILSSFFHFYASSSKNVDFGGAFGIGVPLNGANGIQSATFFLGPSLIIGKEQRMALTAGLMGGKVERLSQGFEVGDQVGFDIIELPKRFPYEIGGFLGLSFNLGR